MGAVAEFFFSVILSIEFLNWNSKKSISSNIMIKTFVFISSCQCSFKVFIETV